MTMRTNHVFVMLVVVAQSALATEVRLRSSVNCAATIVRLSDVAEIHGADGDLAAALGSIALCPAPAIGGQRTLSQHLLRQMLTLSDVDPKQITVTGSEEVVLLSESSSPPVARRATSAMPVRQALYARENTAASISAQPGLLKPATSEPAKPAVAAARLIDRGAPVTVHSNRPGVRIVSSGKALSAGAEGETIPVELADSRERVFARIVGPKIVEIVSAYSARQ